MKLNCKQGDLARVVGSVHADGYIVTCERYLGKVSAKTSRGLESIECWRISPAVPSFSGKPTTVCPDVCLVPIRGGEGVDEMVRVAGLPRERTLGDILREASTRAAAEIGKEMK
jgi:hypothetical protein